MKEAFRRIIGKGKLLGCVLAIGGLTGCAGYYAYDQPGAYGYYDNGYYDDYGPYYGYSGPDIFIGGFWGHDGHYHHYNDHGHYADRRGSWGGHNYYAGRSAPSHGAVGGGSSRSFGGTTHGYSHGGGGSASHSFSGRGNDGRR